MTDALNWRFRDVQVEQTEKNTPVYPMPYVRCEKASLPPRIIRSPSG